MAVPLPRPYGPFTQDIGLPSSHSRPKDSARDERARRRRAPGQPPQGDRLPRAQGPASTHHDSFHLSH